MLVKICGLTTVKEATFVDGCGADYAGLVMFFPKSKRNNTPETADPILKQLNNVKKVAVVVEPTLEQVESIEKLGFDIIQIHGAISQEVMDKVTIPVWKAFNVKDIDDFSKYAVMDKVVGFVFDAAEPGSGKAFDWSELNSIPRDGKLLLLAGGLTPDNVKKAIEVVNPDGVDVSSGVENDNGVGKDFDKIALFCREAHK